VIQRRFFAFAVILTAALSLACTQLRSPEPEQYFSREQPPVPRELRWTNGRMPKTVDPALAAAAPDIDVSRAIFEGLTDLDPVTLEPVPAIAESWLPENDYRTWRFTLREGAKWSDGTKVTAADFVRSWRRVAELGEKAPHRDLMANIVGFSKTPPADPTEAADETGLLDAAPDEEASPTPESTATPSAVPSASPQAPAADVPENKAEFGVLATDDRTLQVTLIRPDKDLPKLVAHPVFRPVPAKAGGLDLSKNAQQIVTSGPFRIASAGQDGVVLDREQNYWDLASVKIDRVRFVPTQNPEKALEAYRNGEVDVVTNSAFSPAAVKLLEPYEDFRRTSYAALNFYELNTKRVPFNDRSIREALAIAIERENLTEGELGGSTRPAYSFTPFSPGGAKLLVSDAARARELLESAGYPNGEGFPVIRLLINRNDTQQRIAKAVARMWKANLNIETEIVVLEPDQLATAKGAGDYDAIRKGVVMPTPNETANFLAMFRSETDAEAEWSGANGHSEFGSASPTPTPQPDGAEAANGPDLFLTEEAALFELPGIPLYFPTSYSLVKPYVKGFDVNSLDAPLLKRVEIDSNWKAK
jgi:ABC-type oligopeptide transport system substrate-binding subunit